MRSPDGSVTVSVFQGTDCNKQPLATMGPLPVKAANSFETYALFTVPSDLLGSGYILKVQGTVNGAAATIYSEAFEVQQLRANGECNPNLPYLPPPPRCSPELAWNVSMGPTGLCKIEANGCRTYRWDCLCFFSFEAYKGGRSPLVGHTHTKRRCLASLPFGFGRLAIVQTAAC